MIFEIIKSEGLAHKSYFIGSKNHAAIVDPRRDCEIYLKLAEMYNLKITHIFETHIHEDFVLGSLNLSNIIDCEIYHGDNPDFKVGSTVKEGDSFKIGSLEFGILETPGHTDESISITLKDKSVSDDFYAVFTGDALFAGEVGRTDLYGSDENQRMAWNLYKSLHEKILPLGDSVIVYPAHGAGSPCGADIRQHEYTTIGYEKKTNPVVRYNREEFMAHKMNEKIEKPPYFDKMAEYNSKGAPILCKTPYLKHLNMEELKEHIKNGAQVVDIRTPPSFAGGHIKDTLNIWKEGLPVFAGWMLNYEDPIILIDEDGTQITDTIKHFIRTGYDNIFGYLEGGFTSWFKGGGEIETADIWSVHKLKENLNDESIFILDARKIGKYEKVGRVEGAYHIFVGYLKDRLNEIPKDKKIVAYCDSGFKTGIAISILQKNGYKNVANVIGSMNAWLSAGYPTVKD
ncbi:MAG: MBL fold metallo-hydrolase [Methanobacterium sp.]|jgi:hydroxyacylglutathione hydrolase